MKLSRLGLKVVIATGWMCLIACQPQVQPVTSSWPEPIARFPDHGDMRYSDYRTAASSFLLDQGPSEIETVLNPDSPGLVRAAYRVLATIETGDPTAVLQNDHGDAIGSVRFGASGIRLINAASKSEALIGPLGSTTGTTQEMFAWHILLTIAGPARLSHEVGGHTEVQLGSARSRMLYRYLFLDNANDKLLVGDRTTRLVKWTKGNSVRVDWLMGNRTWFSTQWSPSSQAKIQDDLKILKSSISKATASAPSIVAVLDYLAKNGIPDASNGTIYHNFVESGYRTIGRDDPVATQPAGEGTGAMFVYRGDKAVISVPPIVPNLDGDSGPYAAWVNTPQSHGSDFTVLKSFQHGTGAPDGVFLIPHGQTWGISVQISSDRQSEFMTLVEERLQAFIRQYVGRQK